MTSTETTRFIKQVQDGTLTTIADIARESNRRRLAALIPDKSEPTYAMFTVCPNDDVTSLPLSSPSRRTLED